jgi:thioredoxin 1
MYSIAQSVLRRTIVAAALTLASVSVQAAADQPYDEKAFQAAKAAGGPVLVEIAASWCPVCKEQGALLDKLSADPKFANVTRFRVDYDDQKAAVKGFHAKSQGTLVLFKGNKEVARTVFETEEPKLRAMLNKAS